MLELGQPVLALARAAQACLHSTPQLSEDQRVRLDTQLTAALAGPSPDRTPIAPTHAGQGLVPLQDRQRLRSHHCPHLQRQEQLPHPVRPQAGHYRRASRRLHLCPGIYPWAIRVMPGMWNPWSTRWSRRSPRVETRSTPAIHSLAGDLAFNDAALREVLHARGILTVGIPRTVEPLPPSPTPEDVFQSLEDADLHHIRTPTQVQLAYACGYSRPVVESIIASLLCRGAARLTYKGHRGAIVQTGMAVMAHNAATLVRIHEYRLSKRARMFRRRLRLRCRKVNQYNVSIN